MVVKQMKTFNTSTIRYIVTDAQAREDIAELQDQVAPLDVSAQSGDVGKALKAKTVANGKVTEYELGDAAIIDDTLSVAGEAADAKETGDAIADLDAAKVNKPTTSPNGTSGQLLRTNGDGTTTWVDQGLPTDEQTADAVSAWLDDHPEATTTVQDGAITKAKLDSNLQDTVDDVDDLKSHLSEGMFIINLTVLVPLPSGTYYTQETALPAIPESYYKAGMVVTYRINENTWEFIQFIAGKAVEANVLQSRYWKKIDIENYIPTDYVLDINKFVGSATTYYTLVNAVQQVPSTKRFAGLIITYRKDQQTWETAQYKLGSVDDTNFYNTDNWEILLPVSTSPFDIARVFNVNEFAGSYSNLYTFSTAIALIPAANRIGGMLVTYRKSGTEWELIQYNKDLMTDATFLDENNWTRIREKNYVFNVNDYTKGYGTTYTFDTAVQQVPARLRVLGMVVMFRSEQERYERFQYVISSSTDQDFYNSSNWLKLPAYPLTTENIEGFDSRVTILASDLLNPSGMTVAYRKGTVRSTVGSTAVYFENNVRKVSVLESYNCPLTLSVDSGYTTNVVIVDDNNVVQSNTGYTAENKLIPAKSAFYIIVSAINDSTDISDLEPNTVVHLTAVNSSQSERRWCAIGDSITRGYISIDEDPGYELSVEDGWAYKLQKITGWKLTNRAIGGTGYVRNHPGTSDAGWNVVQDIDFTQYDFVTVAYGVNDWKYNCPLGTFDDNYETPTTIYGAMRSTIETIIASNPLCKIFMISPINCSVGGSEATNWGIGYPFSNNGTLEAIFQAEKTVAEYYGVEFIDMLHNSIVNRKNIRDCLLDDVHPTPETHTVMAHEIGGRLNWK